MISSRPATEKDSIAGVMPKVVCLPDTVDDAASRIAESERSGESVAFIGAGTLVRAGGGRAHPISTEFRWPDME